MGVQAGDYHLITAEASRDMRLAALTVEGEGVNSTVQTQRVRGGTFLILTLMLGWTE